MNISDLDFVWKMKPGPVVKQTTCHDRWWWLFDIIIRAVDLCMWLPSSGARNENCPCFISSYRWLYLNQSTCRFKPFSCLVSVNLCHADHTSLVWPLSCTQVILVTAPVSLFIHSSLSALYNIIAFKHRTGLTHAGWEQVSSGVWLQSQFAFM